MIACPPRLPGRVVRTLLVALCASLALTLAASAPDGPAGLPRTALAQAPALDTYQLLDVWPDKDITTAGALRQPVGLDVGADDRVYVSDRGVGGVHVMLPSGQFLAPFGVAGSDVERLGTAGRITVDQALGRVYVVDEAVDRLVLYDLDGAYVAHWPDIAAAAVAVGPDSRVYVADRERNAVRAFDPTGAPLFAFGGQGTDDGQFTRMADLSVSPDGTVLAVADFLDLRVQLFDLGATGATFRRDYQLNAPKYGLPATGVPPNRQCRAGVVYALGGDTVWVGDGTGACVLTPTDHTYAIAPSMAGGAVCEATVRLPRLRPATGQFVALGTHDPNDGPCYSTRRGRSTTLPTTPAVLTFADLELMRLERVDLANGTSASDGGLLAPFSVTAPMPDEVYVQDATRFARLFAPGGAPLARAALTDRSAMGISERYWIEQSEASDVVGEVFGYYHHDHRGRVPGSGGDAGATATPTVSATAMPTPGRPEPPAVGANWVEDGHGIGRFRTIKIREYGHEVEILEPIWTRPFTTLSPEVAATRVSPTDSLQVLDLAYDAVTDRLVVLVFERMPKDRSDDARLEVHPGGGTGSTLRWDLPEDTATAFEINPYVDASVGPDGALYVLDDQADVARVVAADGTLAGDVPVAADVKRIGGGPGGTLFGLREPGYVERYARDGTVTARFDGRPFATSDPATLTGVAADAAGRVYTSDAFASVIAVFEPAAAGAPAVPADATCVLTGAKTADPTRLVLGESTRVTLAVDGRCGIGEAPTDIVLTVLYLPQARFRLDNGTDDPAAPIVRELRQLVARIDLRKHRLGIVAYWSDTQVELPLTSDRTMVLKGIQGISRRWPCQIGRWGPDCTAAPNVADAIRAANTQFPTERSRRRLILLYQPDYCNRDFEYRDGECLGYVPAESIARAVRDGGTQIVVFDGNRTGYRQYRRKNDRGQTRYQGDAQPLASSDADVVFGYDQAQHRMVAYRAPSTLATAFRLVDEAPGNMRILSTRISPPATVTGQQVQWDLTALPYGASRFELSLQPLEAGHWPTNVRAVATFTDGWGQAGQITFPVPQVEVVAPTPMPEESTPTARPPTVTPSGAAATATPGGTPGGSATAVYLPIAAVTTWSGT